MGKMICTIVDFYMTVKTTAHCNENVGLENSDMCSDFYELVHLFEYQLLL